MNGEVLIAKMVEELKAGVNVEEVEEEEKQENETPRGGQGE